MPLSIVVWDCYVHGILQSIDWKGENPKINLHSLFVKEIIFFFFQSRALVESRGVNKSSND